MLTRRVNIFVALLYNIIVRWISESSVRCAELMEHELIEEQAKYKLRTKWHEKLRQWMMNEKRYRNRTWRNLGEISFQSHFYRVTWLLLHVQHETSLILNSISWHPPLIGKSVCFVLCAFVKENMRTAFPFPFAWLIKRLQSRAGTVVAWGP